MKDSPKSSTSEVLSPDIHDILEKISFEEYNRLKVHFLQQDSDLMHDNLNKLNSLFEAITEKLS